MRSHLTSVLIVWSLAACDGPSTLLDAGHAVDAASADAGLDASPDASEGDAGEPPLPAPWRRETTFPAGVDHHTSAIVESAAGVHLYVLGGMRADATGQPLEIYSSVWRAAIGTDGTLGPWEEEPPLPAPLAFQAIATSGTTIVLAGGVSIAEGGGLGWIPFIMKATVGDDGHLGAWSGENVLEEATLHGAAAVVGDRFYLVGGGAGAASSHAAVVSVPIDSLAEVRVETSLPAPRSHHVLTIRDGHLYVAGGFEGPPTPAYSMWRAPLDATGAVGAWEEVGTMAEPMWTSAAVTTSDALILIGGGVGGAPTDRVVRLPIGGDGRVGAAELLFSLPYPRAHVHQTPAHAGRLYSVGGRYADGLGQASSTDVYSTEIP